MREKKTKKELTEITGLPNTRISGLADIGILMTQLEGILKALGEDTRLRIMRLLSLQELAVTELVDALDVPQSRVSRHLAILRQAGLVKDRREGNWIYYRLAPEDLAPAAKTLWQAVRSHQDDTTFFPQDLTRLGGTLEKREARGKAYFEAVRDEWDRIRRSYIDDPFSFLVASSLVKPDAVAVDVGAGTGELLLLLAKKAAKVIGVDSSEKMLEACGQRAGEAGAANVELRLGSAEALPLQEGECHAAFSSMVFHHLGDPALGVREMARVVKTGGKVVISDLVKHDYDWVREVMADVWLGFSEEQVCQWLADAGLTDITWSSTAVPWPLEADSAVKLRAFLAGVGRMVKHHPPGSPVKLRAFIASGTKPPR